jgi:hypothetical protein
MKGVGTFEGILAGRRNELDIDRRMLGHLDGPAVDERL